MRPLHRFVSVCYVVSTSITLQIDHVVRESGVALTRGIRSGGAAVEKSIRESGAVVSQAVYESVSAVKVRVKIRAVAVHFQNSLIFTH